MRKKEVKISANEINRYIYCPYQWYYGKVYGQKALKEKYKSLEYHTSGHEGNFKKGLLFHHHYYTAYRIKRLIQIIIILIFILLIIGGVLKCWR